MPRWLILIILLGSLQSAAAIEGYEVSEVVTFTSPDSSYGALEDFIVSAERSLYINVYTFESPAIAELLADASARGVDVILMVEKSPVGGVSSEEKSAIRRLRTAGAKVYSNDDPEVRFNHAKYAIADDEAVLVTSENFGPRGFPRSRSYGNRGWGVIIRGSNLASFFSELFFDDLEKAQIANFRGVHDVSWRERKGAYEPRFSAKTYKGELMVTPLYAPVDALDKILQLIEAANKSLYVEEFYAYKYWGPRKSGSPGESPNMFLEAAINAARRGVEVKILLDSTWYNVEIDDPVSNYYTVEYLEEIASSEKLNLEAKLVDLKKTSLAKVHNKGLIVDDELVLISSVNWNAHSPLKNREIGVIIQGAPATYFVEVFMYDWNAGRDNRKYYIAALVLPVALFLILKMRRKRIPIS
jgi:phosphatidylserine/phosphatidylglycerophosphate/cardiolipin synthase-like enzyme